MTEKKTPKAKRLAKMRATAPTTKARKLAKFTRGKTARKPASGREAARKPASGRKAARKPASGRKAGREAPTKALKKPAEFTSDNAWLWAAYAATHGEAGHAEEWDDATVPQHVRALLLRLVDGPTAFGVWGAAKMPPKPAWFETWGKQLAWLQQQVDALAHDWSWLEANCQDGGQIQVTCNLYHIEIVLDPTHPLYQSRGGPPRTSFERSKLRSLQKVLDRVGQLEPMYLVPERRNKTRLRLMINAGRQRKKALVQHNLDTLGEWWKPLNWMKMPRAEPPVLRLDVTCIISRRSIARALEEGAVLNTSPRRLSKLEMLEEALRLRRQRLSIPEIGEALGGVGRSSVHNLLTLERLHPDLLSLVWSEVMGLSVAYELVRLDGERQLALWTAIKDAPDKLVALKQQLTTAEHGEAPQVLPAKRPRVFSHQSLRAASEALRDNPELTGYVDLVDALLADAGACQRLPPALQTFVASVLGGAT